MGQEIPRNYRMLVFSQPLSRPDEFDPSSESVHALFQGSSHQREEPTHDDDEPMRDPYTQGRGGSHQREEPQGSSPQGEEPRGSSPQGEAPQQDTSAERWWEEHRSSPGSPDGQDDTSAAPHTQEPHFEEEDEVLEAAAAIWETEDIDDDPTVVRTTSSASSTNPLFLYEAGIICSRGPDSKVERNSSGERVINLREWAFL